MKNHTESVTLTFVEFAGAVVQSHLIVTARSLHRAEIDGVDRRVALPQRQNHRAGLHARALLSHHKLAALEVFTRLIQQNGDLYWENMIAIQVAMQAVIVLRRVFEEQRCRAHLARLMTALEKRRVLRRKA